jgi:hypothetical protein
MGFVVRLTAPSLERVLFEHALQRTYRLNLGGGGMRLSPLGNVPAPDDDCTLGDNPPEL